MQPEESPPAGEYKECTSAPTNRSERSPTGLLMDGEKGKDENKTIKCLSNGE